MNNKVKPILSICIPTYNRSSSLKKCLNAIVCQDAFDDRVEVVISDNCSSDNTQEIGEYYQTHYNNIHYYRNDKNLIDENFPLAFKRANGKLLKLTNDTILYKAGAIQYMLEAAENNYLNKPQLFFLNSNRLRSETKAIDTLDEYVSFLGYRLTWIGSVAIWQEDVNNLDIFVNNTASRLGQVPFLINNFKKHNRAIIYCKEIMDSISVDKKDVSYCLFNVFYNNFLGFIKPHVNLGTIKKRSYDIVRKNLLLDFFVFWIVNWQVHQDRYLFSKDENLKLMVEKEYSCESYYFVYKIKMYYYVLRAKFVKFLKKQWNKTK